MASQIDQYDPIFKAAGAEWNVDPTVLKALALHESGGRVDAVGKSGEQGLMQLMPGTQRQLGVTAPFNAEQSIYGGAKYLAMGLDAEHDNPTAALRYYNGGPGWRTSGGDPKYPSYVGAQYVKLAKADTGTLTDATPAATAHADAPDYNNAPAKAPAKPTAAPDGKVPDAYDAALKGKDASKPAAEPDPYTKALGTPAETASKEAGTAPEAVGDVGVSAEDYARATALPSGKPIASLEDLRDRVQQATTDAQRWFAPSPTSAAPPPAPSGAPPGPPMPEGLSGTISPGDVENFARKAAATGVGLAAMPANMLLNALVGIKQLGAGDATTWNPATQTYGVTPEGMMAGQLALGGGLRFSGVNPLVREPPSMLTQAGVTKPLPVTMNELRAAMNRVPPEPYGPPAPPSARPTVEAAAEPPLLSPGDHQWAGGMRDRLAEIQQENQDAGIPGSVGAAATPQQLAQLTPAQMKAYRAQAESGEILRPPEPGMDRSIYVHGSEPTRAEYMGDPAESQKESFTRERDPNTFGPRLKANNQARVNSYEDEMGTQPQLQDLRDNKSLAAEKDGAAYVQAARPLDMTPQLEWLNKQLSDPRIQQSPSRMKVLGELRDALFDADGKLKTDPNAGWGIHDDLIDRLDKSGDRTTAERYAQKQLVEYKRIVDGVNNTASDGAFQTFLDNQTRFAQRINSMEELQKFHTRLTNRAGDINGNAFHKFVADLAARRARPGVDLAMGISDDTMHALINIDKDLKRATNIDLGKSRSSQTNLFGALAQATGIGLAHAGALAVSRGTESRSIPAGRLGAAHKMTGNVLLRRAARRGRRPR